MPAAAVVELTKVEPLELVVQVVVELVVQLVATIMASLGQRTQAAAVVEQVIKAQLCQAEQGDRASLS
jgi:hypothetical protein